MLTGAHHFVARLPLPPPGSRHLCAPTRVPFSLPPIPVVLKAAEVTGVVCSHRGNRQGACWGVQDTRLSLMERKGECCLAAPRYARAWQMGTIMSKFRPIAPKPAEIAQRTPLHLAPVTAAKGKRKAVVPVGSSGKRGRKPKKVATVVVAVTSAPATLKMGDQSVSPTSSSSGMTSGDSSPPPATLPLMPVLSVQKEQVAAAATADLDPSHGAGQTVAPRQALRPAAVTVEAVTGTWRDGEAPPPSSAAAACVSVDDNDEEAPSFVSDQWGRVTWTNTAFDKLVDDDDDASPPETARVVLLAAKDSTAAAMVPAWGTCAGFACRVRVPRRAPLVAPCDVWRIDDGGYLWRLDMQATLSLSIGGGLL